MKNAPAVSQLAGVIAEKISRLATSTHEGCVTIDILRANIKRLGAELISAALSEREEKIKVAKLAWSYLLPHVWEESFDDPDYEHTDYTRAVMKVHAALSALGESK